MLSRVQVRRMVHRMIRYTCTGSMPVHIMQLLQWDMHYNCLLWVCGASDHDNCHALHQQASKPIGFTLQQAASSQAEAAAAAAPATAAAPSAAAATAAAAEPAGDRSCTQDTIPTATTDPTHKAPPPQHADSALLKYHAHPHRWQRDCPLLLELLQMLQIALEMLDSFACTVADKQAMLMTAVQL
jgi:hypothetical protein